MNKTKIDDNSYALLKGWANKTSAYYFSPVYLIGSSIDSADYNDIDVVVIMRDEFFECRFWEVAKWKEELNSGIFSDKMWKMVREISKRWIHAYLFTKLNLDFKILPESYFLEVYKIPKNVRLDDSKF